MNEQTQPILMAAAFAHQGIKLARPLLQASLGYVGEILTHGCEELGEASLGSTMCLGQKLKVACFILDELLEEAPGLYVLLGHDLGTCEDKLLTLGDMVGEPLVTPDFRDPVDTLASDDFGPGEDEFDDDEQPF